MSANGITQWGWKELEEMIHCPVCLDIPSPGMIEQCKHGHHICATCRKNVKNCPLCKCDFYGTRNFILEELVRHFDILKNTMLLNNIESESKPKKKIDKNAVKVKCDSVTEVLQSQPLQRKVNPLLCPKGKYPCRVPNCGKTLPLSRLLNHVRTYHSSHFTESIVDFTDIYTETFEVPFKNKNPINNTCFIIFVSGIGMIFLNIEILKTGQLIGYLQMASSFVQCQQYLGSIELFSEVSRAVETYTNRLTSTRVEFTTMMLQYNCFTLNKNQLKKICANRNFSCKLILTRFDPLNVTVLTHPTRDQIALVAGSRASLTSEQYDNKLIKQLEKNKNSVPKVVPSSSRENGQGPDLEDIVSRVIESLNLQGVISNAVINSNVTASLNTAAAASHQEYRRKQNNKKKKTRL